MARPVGAKNAIGTDIRVLATRYSERALNALVAVMDSPSAPESSRVAAANAILDRAHGKPSQAITATVTHTTHEDALAALAERAGIVARINEGEQPHGPLN